MSNVIPIVSSSPPPLDDDDVDANFKWDDDDDEYGNFTSAANISATTLTSDSSVTVTSDSSVTPNWSTSETSVSAEETPGKKSPIKRGSKTYCDKEKGFNISNSNCNRTEYIIPGCESSLDGILSEVRSQSNDCDENNDGFQDFAHFGSAEFSENPEEAADAKPERKSSQQDVSISPAQNGKADDVDAFEEDEFQEFAQFNDAVVMENLEDSSADKPELAELSQQGHKADSNNISTGHSLKDVPSPSQDQCLETAVADSESAGSVHTKNNDSIYSCGSTIDSGMFSADMSPSCHPSEVSEACLYAEKEESLAHNNVSTHQVDIPASNDLSSGQSCRDANLQNSSEEYCKDVTSLDYIVSDINNSSEDCIVSESSSYVGDNWVSGSSNLSNKSPKSAFIVCNITEGCADVVAEGHCGRFSDSEENDVDAGLCETNNEASTIDSQRIEASSHCSPFTEIQSDVVDTESASDSLACPDVIEQAMDVQTGLPALGSSIISDCSVESSGKNVSLVEVKNVVEGEFRTTDNDEDNDSDVVHEDSVDCRDERSIQHVTRDPDFSRSAECEDKSDIPCDLVCENEDSPTKDKFDSETSEYNCEAVDQDEHTEDCESSAHVKRSEPGTILSESTEAQKDVDSFVEDVEEEGFGDFPIGLGQRDDDDEDESHEVPPITFRTSICESAADEGEDDDAEDFTFDRERPPVLDHEGGSSSHELRGRDSKDISDSEDIDDFGEFDSAQNLQPNNSSTSLNRNDDSEDGFGDFGAADDDAGWADFGSAATPERPESLSSSTIKQVSVPAHPDQSKTQKLRHAVISCFPDSPSQATFDHHQVGSVQGEELEEQSHNGDHGVSPSNADTDPLPLDTVVDLGLSNALEAKQQTWTVVQHPAKKDPKVRLWAHLKDVDSCHALMYGWHTSHCSKEVFTTLHIDTQNILFTHKKQAVPFYASGLGILEPIRGGGAALDRKKDKSSIPATHSTLLESSKYENHPTPATQDIPPVDFDWSSSGLTNPLTANTLDLDFLVIQGSDSYEKTSVFKADTQNSAQSSLQPLEEILKRTTPTVKLSTNEVWSPEAVRVLEKMPDLSFMQSRVLMFPVKQ